MGSFHLSGPKLPATQLPLNPHKRGPACDTGGHLSTLRIVSGNKPSPQRLFSVIGKADWDKGPWISFWFPQWQATAEVNTHLWGWREAWGRDGVKTQTTEESEHLFYNIPAALKLTLTVEWANRCHLSSLIHEDTQAAIYLTNSRR